MSIRLGPKMVLATKGYHTFLIAKTILDLVQLDI